jgi:hypothetical protein
MDSRFGGPRRVPPPWRQVPGAGPTCYFRFATGPLRTGTRWGAASEAHPSGGEDAGRVITAGELTHWRETGAWPDDVCPSDYVELTAEDLPTMGETCARPTFALSSAEAHPEGSFQRAELVA